LARIKGGMPPAGRIGFMNDSVLSAAAAAIDRSHLYSPGTVHIPAADLECMAAFAAAVESVVALPAWQDHVLAWAPEAARVQTQARGVFFGYDFHLTPEGPKLIEINTNAGGALLCAHHCGHATAEESFVAMFRAEWAACRGDAAMQYAIAIVDHAPETQFLYPEFIGFERLFERHGIKAVICDPADLMLCHGSLWLGETRIDMVYNRLTDFGLDQPESAALRQAWEDDTVVVTPHPRAHALYADKRNLVTLCDDALLASWGVDAATRALFAAVIPRTERVSREHADDLHARRKHLFFKPAGGYGAKAAYRGGSITKRVFEDVLAGDYIAQELVPPSTVMVEVDGKETELKADIRNYTYAGAVQLVAARLWQGQTTNFRTPGGGFARVVPA
jgi:hypothetical protein